jgi:predicted membrane channel-forming protein YqfA (hemolysin III family)
MTVSEQTSDDAEQSRLDRNFAELLQEIRVGQAGVQILFGFLLSIAFTNQYDQVDAAVRVIHLVTVMFAAAAVALLTAPAAWHRMLFRQQRRPLLVAAADRLASWGLGCLAFAMTGTIVVLAAEVANMTLAIILGSFAAVGFAVLWMMLPKRYQRPKRSTPESEES